jgi:hypothetical protein
MIERGRVRSVNGTSITIQREMGAACFGCMDAKCKAGKGLVTVENSGGLTLAPGQLVETSVSGLSLALQALTALCPPLAGYAGTFVLTGIAFPGLGEPARAALGVIGLAVAGFVCFKLCRRFRSRIPVKVLRVVVE